MHERFLRDELDVVVATVAFGMGAFAFAHRVSVVKGKPTCDLGGCDSS